MDPISGVPAAPVAGATLVADDAVQAMLTANTDTSAEENEGGQWSPPGFWGGDGLDGVGSDEGQPWPSPAPQSEWLGGVADWDALSVTEADAWATNGGEWPTAPVWEPTLEEDEQRRLVVSACRLLDTRGG